MEEYKSLDNRVEEWHNSDSKLTLQEFLGLTNEEYQAFLLGDEEFTKLQDRYYFD
jgi:hypothetical protein